MRPTARPEPAPCWCGLIPALKRWSRRVRIVRGGSIATIALDLAFPPPDGAGQKTTKNDDKPAARPPFGPDLPGAGRNGQSTLPAALPNRWGDRRRKDPLWKGDLVAAPPRRTDVILRVVRHPTLIPDFLGTIIEIRGTVYGGDTCKYQPPKIIK